MSRKDASGNIALSARAILSCAGVGSGEDMRLLVAATGLSIALLSPAFAETAKSPVQLAPHRAVYDLSLLRAGGSNGVENARGRIAMEFGGDACDGYTLKYRQVTILNSSESGRQHRRYPDRHLSRPATAARCTSSPPRPAGHDQGQRGRRRRASSRPDGDLECRSEAAEEDGVRVDRRDGIPDRAPQAPHRGRPPGRHDPVRQGL